MNIKKITILCSICTLALATVSCTKQEKEYKGTDIDVNKTYENMVNAVTLPEMYEEKSDEDTKGESFGLLFEDYDYSNVKEYYYCCAADGGPEEIAIIKVKDEKEAETLKKIVKKHQQTRVASFKTYDPNQVDVVSQGIIAAKENYVIYVVGEFANRSKAAFDNAFE